MTSPLAGVASLYAICFGAYGKSRKLTSQCSFESNPRDLGWGKKIQQQNCDDPLRLSQIFIAGLGAGVATTVVTAPMELVKLRLQIQGSISSQTKPEYSGALDCAIKIYERQGIRGLYRGTVATLIRDVPG